MQVRRGREESFEAGEKAGPYLSYELDDIGGNRYVAAMSIEGLQKKDFVARNHELEVTNDAGTMKFQISLVTKDCNEPQTKRARNDREYSCRLSDRDCRCTSTRRGAKCCDASRRCKENCCTECSRSEEKDDRVCNYCDDRGDNCMKSKFTCDLDDSSCRCKDDRKDSECCDASSRCQGSHCCERCDRSSDRDCEFCDDRGGKCMRLVDDSSSSSEVCDIKDSDCRCTSRRGGECCDASRSCRGRDCCAECSRREKDNDRICKYCDERNRNCMKIEGSDDDNNNEVCDIKDSDCRCTSRRGGECCDASRSCRGRDCCAECSRSEKDNDRICKYCDERSRNCMKFEESDDNIEGESSISTCEWCEMSKLHALSDLFVCHLRKKVGPCRAKLERFYFDVESKTCDNFSYGGCDGNGNNFKSRELCETVCGGGRAERQQGPTFSTLLLLSHHGSALSALDCLAHCMYHLICLKHEVCTDTLC